MHHNNILQTIRIETRNNVLHLVIRKAKGESNFGKEDQTDSLALELDPSSVAATKALGPEEVSCISESSCLLSEADGALSSRSRKSFEDCT